MSWRTIVITQEAKLSLRLNHLVIKHNDAIKVPLTEIATLIIENPNVSISGHMLNALANEHILTILCDEQHNPNVLVHPTYGHHRRAKKIREQMSWTHDRKGVAWQAIVKQKIYNQYQLLDKVTSDSKKELLREYLTQVEQHDESNREGHAAKVYFNLLYGTYFFRDKEISINWALNYGYTLLCSNLTRVIASRGYLSELGIHHMNEYNCYNLSSDLMEVYRPLVDRIVYDMSFGEEDKIFNKDHRRQLLSMFDKKVTINEKKYTLNHSIQLYVDSFFDYMISKEIKKIYLPYY